MNEFHIDTIEIIKAESAKGVGWAVGFLILFLSGYILKEFGIDWWHGTRERSVGKWEYNQYFYLNGTKHKVSCIGRYMTRYVDLTTGRYIEITNTDFRKMKKEREEVDKNDLINGASKS